MAIHSIKPKYADPTKMQRAMADPNVRKYAGVKEKGELTTAEREQVQSAINTPSGIKLLNDLQNPSFVKFSNRALNVDIKKQKAGLFGVTAGGFLTGVGIALMAGLTAISLPVSGPLILGALLIGGGIALAAMGAKAARSGEAGGDPKSWAKIAGAFAGGVAAGFMTAAAPVLWAKNAAARTIMSILAGSLGFTGVLYGMNYLIAAIQAKRGEQPEIMARQFANRWHQSAFS